MKITIREVFLLLFIAAMAFGWWRHSTQLTQQINLNRRNVTKLALWITQLGKEVDYDKNGEAFVKPKE